MKSALTMVVLEIFWVGIAFTCDIEKWGVLFGVAAKDKRTHELKRWIWGMANLNEEEA